MLQRSSISQMLILAATRDAVVCLPRGDLFAGEFAKLLPAGQPDAAETSIPSIKEGGSLGQRCLSDGKNDPVLYEVSW